MNTTGDEPFDYKAYVKENSPAAGSVQRGTAARRQRFEAASARSAVRIDQDVLEQFRQLASQAQGGESLINQALREWLVAKDVKELLRGELQQIVRQTISSAQE